jgi:TRAP-type mannitol/chloroaromatic compound transport system substrate-binding protein
MFNLKTLTKGAAISAVALSVMATTAMAEKVLRIQSVLPNSADEVKMLEAFGKDVADLTNGSLTLEVLPAGAVVGSRDVLDAVDAGLVEGGFAWTHYWGGKHSAANLFGAPVAGAGVGLDNLALWRRASVHQRGL